MDNIILEDGEKEGFVFSITELMVSLEQLTDPRQARGKRYKLSYILTLIILARLAGEDTPKGLLNG